ncbi:MAG: DNA-formamidopyrimidine glycosylase family protein [Acidobacteriota bacterium]
MPELPEVESARRSLEHWLTDQRLTKVGGDTGRPLTATPATYRRHLRHRRIGAAERRGKQLFLGLGPPDSGTSPHRGLHLHLGMTGRFVVTPAKAAPPRFSRLQLTRDDGWTLHFCDARRIGKAELVEAARLLELDDARALGPDPLLDTWSGAVLEKALASSSRPVKVVLMDQARIAGIGNIQAAEALFRARLSPWWPAQELTGRQTQRLARAVSTTLKTTLDQLESARTERLTALERGDAEADAAPLYLTEGGSSSFLVYGRQEQPCPECGKKLRLDRQDGRSTCWCPRCQEGPGPRA